MLEKNVYYEPESLKSEINPTKYCTDSKPRDHPAVEAVPFGANVCDRWSSPGEELPVDNVMFRVYFS